MLEKAAALLKTRDKPVEVQGHTDIVGGERAGRTVEIRDVQIAGIVNVRRAALATRNPRHFEGCDLALVDPWAV